MNDEAGPAADWSTQRERGSLKLLRLMAWIAVTLGRGAARLVLHPIALYFVLFAPGVRRRSRRYLGRALGRPAGWRDVYRHVHTFAATVLDRVYFARGQMERFEVRVDGVELMEQATARGDGAVLLGAHLGSFEALHAVGASRPGLRVAMVMYPDNATMIQGVLHAIAPEAHLDVIPIGRGGSTLVIRDWLDQGGLAGMLGDRYMPQHTRRDGGVVQLPFLGTPAPFTDGPLRVAMLLRRQVIFMAGLYLGGRRYHVRFEPLADFRTGRSEAALQQALQAYAARLEALCREAPYNWFNFHDFWLEDA